MRRLLLLLGVVVLGLAIACGGGDDSGGGAKDKFCSPEETDAVFDELDFSGATAEIDYGEVKDALKDWEKSAPGEVKDDVKVLADGVRGLLELLEENEGNFLAMAMAAESDPRMLALDSAAFNAASDRLDEYCGYAIGDFGDSGASDGMSGGSTDSGSSDSGSSDSGSSDSGSAGGGFSGAMGLPDDFPTELVPPDSELTFAGSIAGALTGEWASTMTIEEVLAYYSDEYGDPMYVDSESALWSIVDGDQLISVNVAGTDGDLTISVVILEQ